MGIDLLVTGSHPTSSAIRAAHVVAAYTTALLVAGHLYMALISASARPALPGMISGKSISADAVRKFLDGPAARLTASHARPRVQEKAGSGTRRAGRGDLPVRVIATDLSLGFVLDAVVIRTLLVPALVAVM